jgi:hypothetical protein
MSGSESVLTPQQREQHAFERDLSAAEFSRAIYIDFEGFADQSPSLVGLLCEGTFQQVVLDPRLSLAASHSGLSIQDGADWGLEVIEKLGSEGRRCVAFSSHEKNVFEKFFNQDLRPFYADARMIAKKLRRTLDYPSGEFPRDLKSYLKAIGYPRGSYLGEKQSTARIRAVVDMLEKRGSYDRLTAVVKGKWTKLLDHNKVDVLGMYALVGAAIDGDFKYPTIN